MCPPNANKIYKKITRLRNVLNRLVENGGEYDDVYTVSQKLDRLIVLYHKLVVNE